MFIDLVGFGIIIPLSPYLAKSFGATGIEVGLLMAVYSLAQFFFSPIWGRLSDKFGRRPIILISVLGAAISHLAFAFASDLWILFAARTFAGIFGANISVATAYIADVTDSKNRSKNMGIIGAAFGMGFILGPAIGGLLAELGESLGSTPPYGMGFPALGASLICFFNFCFAYFKLPESLKPENRSGVEKRVSRFKMITEFIVRPVIGPLMFVNGLFVVGMGQMEATLALFVKEEFKWDLRTTSFAFAYIGVMIAFTQGYLIRKLLPKYGERKLLAFGLILAVLGMGWIGLSNSVTDLALAMTLFALGNGLVQPTNLGSLSLLASEKEQGRVMGVNQSFSAMGRIIGPFLGGVFFDKLGMQSPYLVSAGLMLVCFLIVSMMYKKIPSRAEQ